MASNSTASKLLLLITFIFLLLNISSPTPNTLEKIKFNSVALVDTDGDSETSCIPEPSLSNSVQLL